MKDFVITPEILLKGYANGIFPMAESREDPEIFWVDPKKRGILPLNKFHISRSLARTMRQSKWTLTTDKAFEAVVSGCADRTDTWINSEIRHLYSELYVSKHAHSIEVWEDTNLVGGIYGVVLGAAFFGESMFSHRANASKMALAGCIDRLQRAGYLLFDTQFLTDHLASLGAIEVTRAHYHRLLYAALIQTADFNAPSSATFYDIIQRKTQIS